MNPNLSDAHESHFWSASGVQKAAASPPNSTRHKSARAPAAPARIDDAAQQHMAEQAARIQALEQSLNALRQQVEAQATQGRRTTVRRASKRFVRALRREVFRFLPEPMSGAERALDTLGTYRCQAKAASFALTHPAGRLPYGWVRIRTRFVGAQTASARLRLCLDNGDGFRATDFFHLPAPSSAAGDIETFHYLPPSLHQMRLDVVTKNDGETFVLEPVAIQEVTKQEVLTQLLLRAARERRMPRGRWPHAIAKLTQKWLTGGAAGLLTMLHSRNTQPSMQYADWVERYDTLTEADLAAIDVAQAELGVRPQFSIIMPVYNPPLAYLKRAIESVQAQRYDHWELCLADDASSEPHVADFIRDVAARDARIKVVFRKTQGHICAASNDALALATGAYVVFLDHDDELREHALYLLADALNKHPDAKLLYSDEDKLDADAQRYDPYFKPDYNPDLLRSQNYINHLSCFALDSVRAVGNLRAGFEGSQDYDLVLRIAQQLAAHQIQHIPHVLYLWRSIAGSTAHTPNAKPYTFQAAQRALVDDLKRRKQDATVVMQPDGFFRTQFALPDVLPLVSIIIPTRDQVRLLRQCIESIQNKTSYHNYEIIIVDNNSVEAQTLAYFKTLKADPRIRVMPYHKVFNYAAINNAAADIAQGSVLCLLNNDIEVINTDWLDELVSQALRPEIGAVGAKLYYADESLQHAGVVLGLGGIAGHAHKHLPKGNPGPFSRANLVQNYAAVTGACLAIRRQTYQKVGGLDEALRVAFNDVDFCLRVGALGLRNLYTPYAQLFHHESATRGTDFTPAKLARANQESALMRERWGDLLTQDPHYNPNLTLKQENFSLAFPPRAPKPWLAYAPHTAAEDV